MFSSWKPPSISFLESSFVFLWTPIALVGIWFTSVISFHICKHLILLEKLHTFQNIPLMLNLTIVLAFKSNYFLKIRYLATIFFNISVWSEHWVQYNSVKLKNVTDIDWYKRNSWMTTNVVLNNMIFIFDDMLIKWANINSWVDLIIPSTNQYVLKQMFVPGMEIESLISHIDFVKSFSREDIIVNAK